MDNKHKYNKYQTLDLKIKQYDDTIINFGNNHCCEKIKISILKTKEIIISKESNKVLYNEEEIKKWMDLVNQNLNKNISYEISESYHKITFKMQDFDHFYHFYETFIVVRWLWYAENNFLIDRTLDILNTQKFNFKEALLLAHIYDNPERDETFNLMYPYTFNLESNTKDYICENMYNNTDGTLNLNSLFLPIFTTNNYLKNTIKAIFGLYYNNFINSYIRIHSYLDVYSLLKEFQRKITINFNSTANYNNDTISSKFVTFCKDNLNLIIEDIKSLEDLNTEEKYLIVSERPLFCKNFNSICKDTVYFNNGNYAVQKNRKDYRVYKIIKNENKEI
jgi:hypothetical protein